MIRKRKYDLTNCTFGMLTVIKEAPNGKWLSKCTCGNSIECETYSLRNKDTISCGCYRKKIRLSGYGKLVGHIGMLVKITQKIEK